MTQPFPLWALLTIYYKAEYTCYIDYMKGFKELTDWLSPITPTLIKNKPHYIKVLSNYETQEMAKYLNYFEDEILSCIIYEVLPKLKEDSSK